MACVTAHNLLSLWGQGDAYRIIGGQGWPASIENQIGPSWGFPGRGTQAGHEGVGSQWPQRGYIPDWSRTQPAGYHYAPRL